MDRYARELLDATPVGHLLVDREIRCSFVNSALLAKWGFREADVLGRPFAEVFPGLAPQVARILREVVGIGESFVNIGVHEPDTQRRWTVSAVPVCDARGQVARVAVTLLEAPERAVDDPSSERESLFQAVFEEAAIAMTVMDWRDKGVRVNSAAREMLGYSEEELNQLGIQGFSDPEDYAIDLQHFHRLMAGEIERYQMVKRFLHKNGGVVWTNLTVSLTRDGRGQPSLIISTAENITDQKRAEQEREKLQAQLLHAQKLESLGVLAGGIAHDFNNFLTAIMGSASVARRRLPSESAAGGDLDNVIDAARRAASLTRQLVAYAGKGKLDVRVVDLSAEVQQLTNLLRSTISKRIELQLDLAPELPAIRADLSQLQQVVMNLVINAAEALGDTQGQVGIATGTQQLSAEQVAGLIADAAVTCGPYNYVEVQDGGSGMDETTVARIFDPFFTTKFAGRGLGLAAVIGIVRSHGGAIDVRSVPGQGTTFRVYLPVVDDQPESVPESDVWFQGAGTALLIDDDNSVRRAVKGMLEGFGFCVLDTDNGSKGIQLLVADPERINLVLLDMTMPGVSGEETFRELNRIRADVPVVLISGYPEEEALARFADKGPAGFIQKPFSSKELSRKLSRLLRKHPTVRPRAVSSQLGKVRAGWRLRR